MFWRMKKHREPRKYVNNFKKQMLHCSLCGWFYPYFYFTIIIHCSFCLVAHTIIFHMTYLTNTIEFHCIYIYIYVYMNIYLNVTSTNILWIQRLKKFNTKSEIFVSFYYVFAMLFGYLFAIIICVRERDNTNKTKRHSIEYMDGRTNSARNM